MGVPAALAAAATSSIRVTVTPKAGQTRTKFVVSFKAPASTDGSSTTHRYTVSASTSSGASTNSASGCVSTASKAITSATAGERVQVKIKPGSSGAWCTGTYKGLVRETTTPKCSPGEACPMYIAIATIGTFDFRVK